MPRTTQSGQPQGSGNISSIISYFTEDKWVVSSQQPPTHQSGDLRRVDVIVEKMDSNATTVGTLLFLEAKRASASPSDILEVEYQAFSAACAYWVQTSIPHLWTMTCVGSRARLWIFSERSDYLIPFVPRGHGLSKRSEYLELSTNGREIADGLDYIKKHITPPTELLEMTPSPRPAHATLPAGWHDDEVGHLDAVHQQDVSANTMDLDEGPSTFATAQLPQEANYDLDDENHGWATGEEIQGNSAGQLEAEGYPDAGSSEVPHGGNGRQEVEVRLNRTHHTFKKDELCFDKNGRTVSTTEDDWVKGKRDQRTVWIYHGKETVYWTRKLP